MNFLEDAEGPWVYHCKSIGKYVLFFDEKLSLSIINDLLNNWIVIDQVFQFGKKIHNYLFENWTWLGLSIIGLDSSIK